MGSVFRRKRKDTRANRWYVEFSHGGKRIRRLARGAETKTEAKAFLREIERQIDRGDYIPKKKKEILFELWADKFFEWSKLNKRSWKRDKIFMRHLKSFFKGKLLQGISPMLIEDYKKKRKADVSGATVNRELSCLKHMLNKAIDEGILMKNPVKKVRFFHEDNTIERILLPDEKERLISKSEGYIKAVIIIALNTGMRRGEILNLDWSQIDFTNRYIKVEKTKSGKARTIPTNSLVLNTLRQLEQKKDHYEYIFWNSKSNKPTQDVRKVFKKSCEAAGIKDLRFHDLRHNFASSLVENGVDIVTVSELLGHSNINLTAKRYSHPSPLHKRQAVEALLVKKEEKSSELLTEILPERLFRAVN